MGQDRHLQLLHLHRHLGGSFTHLLLQRASNVHFDGVKISFQVLENCCLSAPNIVGSAFAEENFVSFLKSHFALTPQGGF